MRFDSRLLPLAGLALAGVARGAHAQQATARPFDGFVPGRCVIAAREIDRVLRRGMDDTAAYAPARDTLFTTTADSIRMCQASFGGTTSDEREALALAQSRLFTRQDSVALATARRHLSAFAKRTPAERAWELYLVAIDNLAGKPARLAPAHAASVKMDALGKPAASVRVLAHYELAFIAFGRSMDSTTRAETDAAIAAWKELPQETRLWRSTTLASTYLLRAQLEALTKGGDAARATIDTALATLPLEAKMARALVGEAKTMYAIMGKKAAPIEAAFWYNTGAPDAAAAGGVGLGQVSLVAAPAPSARPTRGKVSILLDVYRPCTGGCFRMLASMRRYAQRFQPRDVEITFHTKTYGFYLDTAPATPLAEAQYDSSYLVHDLQLPGALAIAETQYSWKADGRRINAPTANETHYPATGVAFIDKQGVIRLVTQYWDRRLEERYAKMIEGWLKEGGGAVP
ncbi:MAG TPA: hypothetical protein VF041_11995 [Gemmatimonadaceae bacterium]